VSQLATRPIDIDVLNLTLGELSTLLQNGNVTSVDLVQAYLAQIEKHNKKGAHLNAIINVVPREKLLAIARDLDNKRHEIDSASKPLWGIPFLVKVNLPVLFTFSFFVSFPFLSFLSALTAS